jgi:hypothetical protein
MKSKIRYISATGLIAITSGCGNEKETAPETTTSATPNSAHAPQEITLDELRFSEESVQEVIRIFYPKKETEDGFPKIKLNKPGSGVVGGSYGNTITGLHSLQPKKILTPSGQLIVVIEFSLSQSFFQKHETIIRKWINEKLLQHTSDERYYFFHETDFIKFLLETDIITIEDGERSVFCDG